ncbi:MAG: 5'-3' exonuclease H3TH domain-containing protein [Myxococcota bacterium]
MNLLLDGYSLLFRAFYALPPMNTRDGAPTSALYGVSVLLCKLLREHRPTAVALALDAPGPTTRQVSYAAYKAGRAPTPDPLRAQIARLPELAAALGAPVHRVPGWEADDILATLTRRVKPTIVVTGDTDLLQVVDPDTAVLFVGQRQKDHVLYDVAAVQARYGFDPAFVPTYKAMAGDASDNLPGIPGIGAKTAARLIAAHGDAAGILAGRGSETPKIRAILDANAEALVRWESMARVREDLPLDEPLVGPIASWDGLRSWFTALEFKSLVPRVDALPAPGTPR